MQHIIVSRHPAAVEFIRLEAPEFANAPVIAQATAEDVRGKVVAGNLPMHLAAEALEVVAVELPDNPPRGREYSLDEMRAAGARLRRYVVIAIDELITIAEAARLAGVPVSTISSRIDRGQMRAFVDPDASQRQGRRLVRRGDALRYKESREGDD